MCDWKYSSIFLNAIQDGYAIELDLRITRYGEAVVFHDRNIKRLTGINKEYMI